MKMDMKLKQIREKYNVPAFRGATVLMGNSKGKIVGTDWKYIVIKFDDDKKAMHPLMKDMIYLKEIKRAKTVPLHHIPCKNRWGHWVWRRPDFPMDMNWPGHKPPTDRCEVVEYNGKWHFKQTV